MKLKNREKDVIALLSKAQRENKHNYITEEKLKIIAQEAGLSYSEVYGVATFYSLFSLKPRGEYVIRVCDSGPCHLMGSRSIFEVLEEELKIKVGETTPDGEFTLEETSCLGICDEAPAMMINEKVYSNLTPQKIKGILRKLGDKK
ncbi:MAG: NADH-quinone oxidoreductase subunit NuoE [Candidatus Aerophobetes bacterium]|nr:NADH-quinone oxidoreductase subunit NuoE [Candidatus Aerophobetes bacterium]